MDDKTRALLGDHEATKLAHLSLFSGIGGLDLAAEWAGFTTVGQCEWADYPTRVLEKHWPDVPRWRDIRTLTKESFYEKTGLRTVDIISGGFPCQPHSVIGKRLAENDERHLWPEFLRVIDELRPRYVVGENVNGILSTIHESICTDLEKKDTKSGRSVFRLVLSERTMKDTGFVFLASPRASQDFKPIRRQTPQEHSGKHGQTLSASLGIIFPERIGQYITPQFAEWMMGFPIGWGDIRSTNSGCSVTETP